MVLHDADGFLTQLTRMLERSREKGAVYVTMKRCAFAPAAPAAGAARLSVPRPPPRADAGIEGKRGEPVDPADCRCLVRAVLGSTKATATRHRPPAHHDCRTPAPRRA